MSFIHSIIRTFLLLCALASAGCATVDAPSRTEVAELSASLRALRAENARIETKLEKLEQQMAVVALRPGAAGSSKPTESKRPEPVSEAPMPVLAVVKLKPKREAPVPLMTNVDVEEPNESALAALQVKATGADGAMSEDAQAVSDAQFSRGEELLKTGSGELGINQMLQFVTDWPRHPKADNALYLAGLARLAARDVAGAEKLFDRVSQDYPAGDTALEALLKTGECRTRLNKTADARAVYQHIIASYPGTSAATQAQARLK